MLVNRIGTCAAILLTVACAAGLASGPLARAGAPSKEQPVKKAEGPAGVEQLLYGDWKGEGLCIGNITFKVDGTYEWRDYGPSRSTLAGKWSLRWDALPPTLDMECTVADSKGFVGMKLEMKVIRLDGQTFVYQAPKESPIPFSRIKK